MRSNKMLRLCSTLLVTAPLAGVIACNDRADLNTTCQLVKRDAGDPTGQTATPLLLSDIPPTRTDYISFGSPDCDDRICVRDYQYTQNGGYQGDSGVAYGYCSSPCTPGASNQCLSYTGDLDKGNTQLNCRPLLLDQQSLAAICAQDAGACTTYFSNTRSPFFCARGQSPDGGP